jgi:hypothetical protein
VLRQLQLLLCFVGASHCSGGGGGGSVYGSTIQLQEEVVD